MYFKRFIKSAVCIAVGAAAMLTMSGCKNYSKMIKEQPEEYIKMAAENTAELMFKSKSSDEYSAILDNAMKDGTFTLDFEAEGITFNGECCVNEKQGAASQSYTITGADGISAQIYIYTDKSSMKFGTIGQSGSHIYDVNFSTLAEKLADSIFAPDSGSSYSFDQDSYDRILEYFEEIRLTAEDNREISNDYQAIIDSYLESHKPITEEKIDTDISGETIKSNIFTYEISYDDVKMIFEQLIDAAIKETGEDGEDVKMQMQEMFERLDDCKITLVYYINSKTNVLMKSDFTLNVTADGETAEIYMDALYGADPENSEKKSFKFGVKDSTNDNYFLADIISGENRSEMSITMNDDGEEKKLLTLASERDGDSYIITADLLDLEYTASVKGTVTADKNSFNLTVDRISAAEGATEISYSPNAVVNIRKGGELLKLDAEKEYLDITETEMDELVQNIQSDFSAVFNQTAEAVNDGISENMV